MEDEKHVHILSVQQRTSVTKHKVGSTSKAAITTKSRTMADVQGLLSLGREHFPSLLSGS